MYLSAERIAVVDQAVHDTFEQISQIAFKHDPRHPEGEPFSESGSLYHPSRSSFPSAPAGEFQPNSPYVSARSATSGTWAPAAPASLYSSPAAPAAATGEETHRGQERKAVSGNRPEEIELVRPLKDPSR